MGQFSVENSASPGQLSAEINILASHCLVGSMGRRGNPYDNAKAESLMTPTPALRTRQIAPS
jgi:transposase InsO family protein